MYIVGDFVLHSTSGVCKIEDIREENFTDKTRSYYVLNPIIDSSKSTLYVPVDTQKCPFRKLLKKVEIHQVIAESLKENIEWIDSNNIRKVTYSDILHSDDTSKIIALIVCLHERKKAINDNGKKFSIMDEQLLNDAEKRIHQEFAYVLSIKEQEVPEYILGHCKMH